MNLGILMITIHVKSAYIGMMMYDVRQCEYE